MFWTMASARMVAVVVPSPASFAVLVAASRAASMMTCWIGSLKPSDLKTVTPSLVIRFGRPSSCCSINTCRPPGPRVEPTASAIKPIVSMTLEFKPWRCVTTFFAGECTFWYDMPIYCASFGVMLRLLAHVPGPRLTLVVLTSIRPCSRR
jgi:hypothetical protein